MQATSENYVAENNDIATAEDVKRGLESPPVQYCWHSSCSLSKISAANGNNRIPGVTRYYNFYFEEDGMRIWQVYGVGEGIKIKDFEK